MKQALIVVDVQHGLFKQKKPIYQGKTLIKNIVYLIEQARLDDIPIIFIQHTNKGILKFGSSDWQLHKEIKPLKDELIIYKTNASAFKETNLDAHLKKNNINQVIFLGLTTQGCIRATCLDAVKSGYDVILVGDAHSSYHENAKGLIEIWNKKLREKGVQISYTNKLL